MLVLSSEIKTGKDGNTATFTNVNEVQVKRSIHNLGATAVIKVPATAVLKRKGHAPTHIETVQQVNIGDPVAIRLGYNGQLNTEFTGYVKNINHKIPLEIECEDEFYNIRQLTCRYSKETTRLNECIGELFPEVETGKIAELTLRNFIVNDDSGAWVLNKLKSEYGLTVFFDIEGRLNVGSPIDFEGETIKYRMHYNVVKDDELKYQQAENNKAFIKAVCYLNDGTQVKSEAGQRGGKEQTIYFYDVENETDLKAIAEDELRKYSFDGYRGKFTTFLIPYALPGMIAALEDPAYPELDGHYFIESTEVTFGTGGARRTVEIGRKV